MAIMINSRWLEGLGGFREEYIPSSSSVWIEYFTPWNISARLD